MTITLCNRLVAMLAGSLAVCATVMMAAAAPAVPQATGAAAQRAAVRYWTSARMTAALRKQAGSVSQAGPAKPRVLMRRLEHRLVHQERAAAAAAPWLSGDTGGRGLRWGHGGAVAAAAGKVFFTLGGSDYVCSGVLVGGAHPDVVLTAAHCVTGGSTGRGGKTQWATDWVFVPGYRDGRVPYGEYTARRFFVTRDWAGAGGGAEQDDVAFVQVTAAEPHSAPHPGPRGTARAPREQAQPPHGLPIAFATSQDAARAYVFGYPALAPYDGLYPYYCAGPAAASDGSLRTACGMTAGDSGGPWLAGFRPRSGAGTVVAVSTYKLSADPRLLYGAVLGPAARALYRRATGAAGSRR